jgi:hypothetical protein
MFFTTAFTRWECPGCGSILAVSVSRRILIGLTAGCIPLGISVGLRPYGAALAYTFLIALIVGLILILLYFFDQAVVVERRGLRCKKCGYDLQGQTEARCPECGTAFEPALLASKGLAGAGRRHRTTWVWTIVAVVTLMLLASVLLGLHQWRRAARPRLSAQTRKLYEALPAYADRHGGKAPDHAIALAGAGDVLARYFISPASGSAPDAVQLGDVTLARFDALTPPRKQEVVAAAAAALPGRVIVHRLGDFVFTYHGIDFANAAPELWVVLWSPDPGQNPPAGPGGDTVIGTAGGQVERIKLVDLAAALAKQNALRAQHGLPPLTNPLLVTHEKPRVAPPDP